MKFNRLSYRTQIFLASLLLVTLPTTLIGIITANRNASSIVSDYNSSMETILTQTNLTLDTLLSDATKIADLPLLNQDIKKAMMTNYGEDYFAYSLDSTKFKNQFNQTNRLNQNLLGLILALILSNKLTNSIQRLCQEIDSLRPDSYSAVPMAACGSNQELRKLITSFNNLNLRLSESLQQKL